MSFPTLNLAQTILTDAISTRQKSNKQKASQPNQNGDFNIINYAAIPKPAVTLLVTNQVQSIYKPDY